MTESQKINLYHEATEWLKDTVYQDLGRPREVFTDEDGRMFFHSHPLDFDKDDTHTPDKYYLDECEGWKEEYSTVIT